MELVKHAINFSQRDVEGAVELSLYKVRFTAVELGTVILGRGGCLDV